MRQVYSKRFINITSLNHTTAHPIPTLILDSETEALSKRSVNPKCSQAFPPTPPLPQFLE